MVMQLDKLKWPLPDIVTSIPCSFLQFLGQSYQPSKLLAENIAQLCNIEVFECLKRHLDGTFHWRAPNGIADKRILVIEDGSAAEKTVSRFVNKIREGFPKAVYVLNFLVE